MLECWSVSESYCQDGGVGAGVGAGLGVVKKQTPIQILIWKCFRLISRQWYILLQERGNKIPLEIKKRNLEIKQPLKSNMKTSVNSKKKKKNLESPVKTLKFL